MFGVDASVEQVTQMVSMLVALADFGSARTLLLEFGFPGGIIRHWLLVSVEFSVGFWLFACFQVWWWRGWLEMLAVLENWQGLLVAVLV